MDKISAWSASVMCACVICAAVKFLIPEAQKKIIGFVLGLFMLSVIIEPFGQLVSAVKNFEISDITGDIQTSENVDIISFYDQLTAKEGCRVLKEETEQKLRAFGVSGADVEIIYSVSAEDRVITVQGARISLSKGQKHRKIQIEKYIKEQTGLDSWVYIEGESENEEF